MTESPSDKGTFSSPGGMPEQVRMFNKLQESAAEAIASFDSVVEQISSNSAALSSQTSQAYAKQMSRRSIYPHTFRSKKSNQILT